MADRKNRQSNIELLRIFAALGVVVLHLNNPAMCGGFDSVAFGSIEQFLMVLFESICICAVNIFVLISGYFMRDSMRRDLLKPVELLSMYIVFETASWLVRDLRAGSALTLSGFLGYLRPSYWFVFVYIALYLISPYINKMLKGLGKKEKKILLILSFLLFSVQPAAVDLFWSLSRSEGSQGLSSIGLFGSGAGYTIVNFVLMYLIGCCLRGIDDEDLTFKTGKLIFLLVTDVLLMVFWIYSESAATTLPLNNSTALNYENPLVIFEAVIIFLLFKNMKIRNNRVINRLAAASFPTYLIHINIITGFDIEVFVRSGTASFVILMAGTLIAVYLVCFVIFTVYDLITRPLVRLISEKWRKGRFITVNEAKQP